MGEDKIDRCLVISWKEKRNTAKKFIYCECKQVTGDPDTQLIECNHCGRIWTAWEWIYTKTAEKRWLEANGEQLRKEVIKLTEEVRKLKTQRSYLKRQTRKGDQQDVE